MSWLFPGLSCAWTDSDVGVDSAEGLADCLGGAHAWVRGAGFDTAWEMFGPRKV